MSNVVKQLNQIQADVYVMFLKLHNLHWNVKGMDFYPIHEYTESAYNSMAGIFDEVAERVLQLGGTPLTLNSQLVKQANIKESEKTSFSSKEVLSEIEEDYKYFLKSFKTLAKEADEENDSASVGIADENIAKLEKDLWILKASLGK